MDRKMIMGIAAVAGIGLLLYMRKQGDGATLAGSSALVSAVGGGSAWASQPIVINANTKPLAVDGSATSPAPAPPPPKATAPADLASWGGVGTGAQVTGVDNGSSYGKPGPNGTWIWPDGTTSGGGVSSSAAMSVLGY